MPSHTLSIAIEGTGEDPNHRSHWSFLLSCPGSSFGTLLQVQVISLEGLIYQFESRTGHPFETPNLEGRVILGDIEATKYNQVVKIISGEPAPRNGKVSFQESLRVGVGWKKADCCCV